MNVDLQDCQNWIRLQYYLGSGQLARQQHGWVMNAREKARRCWEAVEANGVTRARLIGAFADVLVRADSLQKVPEEPKFQSISQGIAVLKAETEARRDAFLKVLSAWIFAEIDDRPAVESQSGSAGSEDGQDSWSAKVREILLRLHGEDHDIKLLGKLLCDVAMELSAISAGESGHGGAPVRSWAEGDAAQSGPLGADSSSVTDSAAVRSGSVGITIDPSGNRFPSQEPAASETEVSSSLRPTPLGQWVWMPPDPDLPCAREGPWKAWVDGFGQAEALGPEERFVAAVARGRGHKQDALYCDDSFRFLPAGSWRIVVASDGAGSAKFSRVGSEIACEKIEHCLRSDLAKVEADLSGIELLESDLFELSRNPAGDARMTAVLRAMSNGFDQAMQAISGWVEQRNSLADGVTPERLHIDSVMRGSGKEVSRVTADRPEDPLRILDEDCNCTLLVAAFTVVKIRKSDGTLRKMAMIVSCAVGDGMIVAFRRLAAARPHAYLLMAPDTGQFAGQTQFLSKGTVSAESVGRRLTVGFIGAESDIVAIAAMTDGVADDYYEGEAGMERLYCDLILNGILPVEVDAEEIARERDILETAIRDRARTAADRAAALEFEWEKASVPADRFRIGQDLKAAKDAASRDSLKSLVRMERILERPRDGESDRTSPVKYASVYGEVLGLTAAQMLARPGLLRAIAEDPPATAAAAFDPGSPGQAADEAADRLCRWLDTYIVKGSFDDRTMVLLQTGVRA